MRIDPLRKGRFLRPFPVMRPPGQVETNLAESPDKRVAPVDHQAALKTPGYRWIRRWALVADNPASGTPSIEADPRAAPDLASYALVWQDGDRTRSSHSPMQALAATGPRNC